MNRLHLTNDRVALNEARAAYFSVAVLIFFSVARNVCNLALYRIPLALTNCTIFLNA